MAGSDGSCPVLPSADHASQMIRGEPGGIPGVAIDVVLRAGLIGIGMYAFGCRQNLIKYALGGSLGIEAFVLTWIGLQRAGVVK